MPILMFLIVVLALSFVLTSLLDVFRNKRRAEFEGSSGLPRLVRYACMLAGIALLGVVVFGTLNDLGAAYDAAGSDREFQIRWPSVEEPPLTEEPTYLVNLILTVRRGAEFVPVEIKSRVVSRLGGRGAALPLLQHQDNGMKLRASLQMKHAENSGLLRFYGDVDVRQPGSRISQGVQSTVKTGEFMQIATQVTRPASSFLSMRRSPGGQYAVIGFVQEVSPDDPCTEISLDTARSVTEGWPRARIAPAAPVFPPPMPGFAYAIHLGRASMTLLCGGLLLVLFFRRRSIALPVVLFFVLVVGISMDRFMLGIHTDRMTDPAQPLAVRCLAADHVGETFFFGHTAMAAVEDVVSDDATPEGVAASAERSRELVLFRQQPQQ